MSKKLRKTCGTIQRFPRLEESEVSEIERAELEASAFQLIGRRRTARVKLGRIFLKLKADLKYGGWNAYFDQTFGEEISLRTAERYMDAAREADAKEAHDKLSNLETAEDSEALSVRGATAEAEVEKKKARRDPIFKLPIYMTKAEQEIARSLVDSPHWLVAQVEVLDFLKKLYSKFITQGDDA